MQQEDLLTIRSRLDSNFSQLRERDLRRARAAEQEAKKRAEAEKKDGKDERMEGLLRKVHSNWSVGRRVISHTHI